MSQSLPFADRPPETTTDLDRGLQRQLEMSISRHFFEVCAGPSQSLLMECGWTIQVAETLILVIHCSDQEKNWRVLNHMAAFAERLSQLSPRAKIRVYPPSDKGKPFDMRVDERSTYQEPF